MNSRILTYRTLVEHRACAIARQKFKQVFGEQVEVTPERFSKEDVIDADFDYDWAADCLLSREGHNLFYARLRKKRDALKEELNVCFYTEIPWDVRRRIEPPLWAEIYVSELEGAKPEGVEAPGPVFPEETVNGN